MVVVVGVACAKAVNVASVSAVRKRARSPNDLMIFCVMVIIRYGREEFVIAFGNQFSAQKEPMMTMCSIKKPRPKTWLQNTHYFYHPLF